MSLSNNTLTLNANRVARQPQPDGFNGLLSDPGAIVVGGAFNWTDRANITGSGTLVTNGTTQPFLIGGSDGGINRAWTNNGTVDIVDSGYLDFTTPAARSPTPHRVINFAGGAAN